MKSTILFISSALLSTVVYCQQPDTITLERCLESVVLHSPLNRQKSNFAEIMDYRIRNLNSNWYPSVGINAQASYNSETVDFSEVLPNAPIPSLPLDQYKVWADIHQQLYDGGYNRALKEMERTMHQANLQQTESEILAARIQVSQVYFSLLLTQMNAEMLNISLNELRTRKSAVQSAVDNGILLQENLLALDAEEINMQQRVTELELMQNQFVSILCILLDSTISGNTKVIEPVEPEADTSGIRPEFKLFEIQKEQLTASQKMISATELPKLFAFSQLAYGRPGYNMISQDFHTFYTVGAGLKWNFLNYGDNKRQKRIFEIQKDQIEVKREHFSDQLKIQLETERTNMVKFDSLIRQDEKIVNIRKSIAAASLSKLNYGIITSSDYVTDMNAEILARLQWQNHRILKMQSYYNYLIFQGKF